MPSEKLIERLIKWLVGEKYIRAGEANRLQEELITLKYFGSLSPFVRQMALAYAQTLPGADDLLSAPAEKLKAVRGRPRKQVATGMALVAETPEVYKVKRRRRSQQGE